MAIFEIGFDDTFNKWVGVSFNLGDVKMAF
jgi:hypothetical protein